MSPNNQLTLQVLSKQRDSLASTLEGLRKAQRDLRLDLAVGSSWCAALSFLHAHVRVDGEDEQEEPEALPHAACLQEGGGPERLAALLADKPQTVQTVSPAHDPMAGMRRLFLQQAPAPGVLTTMQMAEVYKQVVVESALRLHALEAEAQEQRQQLLERMTQQWERYYFYVVSMVRAGQLHELEAGLVLNLETMQPDAEGANQHAARVPLLVAPQLGLTQQQRELIAAGMRLCLRQLDTILAERARLQALPRGDGDAAGGVSSGAVAAVAAAIQSGGGGLAAAEARRAGLAAEQQRMERLRLVLRKEHMIRTMGISWILGLLSWEQVAKAAAVWWPYKARWLLLGKVLCDGAGTARNGA